MPVIGFQNLFSVNSHFAFVNLPAVWRGGWFAAI